MEAKDHRSAINSTYTPGLGKGMEMKTQTTKTYEPTCPIGISPSMDSTTSDVNFLKSEIRSFFSQKHTSVISASMVSTSVSEAPSSILDTPGSRNNASLS